jgi:methionyl-tRNA formyltransferase
MTKPLSIIFMGTPEFAVPALYALNQNGHPILLVATQPDRPKGRGRKMHASAVKTAALELNCPVIQPKSVRTTEFIQKLKNLKPDVIAVIAYGHILPTEILQIPEFGAINIHASLLPEYRGPAPIQWAIINGEKETGVTAMRMDQGLDTGDILMKKTEHIMETDTAALLHDRLAKAGAALLLETLAKIQTNSIQPIPQDHARATYAPLLSKNDGRINWTKSARQVDALIRGMTPWPGAFTYLGDRRLKIFSSKPIDISHTAEPGSVLKGFADELRIAAGNGALLIFEIQEDSGKRMKIKDFLRGHAITPGERLC